MRWPWRKAAAADPDPRQAGIAIHTATDGRDTLINTPDGWEVDQPARR